MRPQNPCEFKVGTLIESVYTGNRYTVLTENNRHSLMKLQNEAGGKEDWNGDNNPHFKLASPQLKLAL